MTFYVFSCSADKTLFGVTSERTGAKLPKDTCQGGTWLRRKQVEGSRIAFSAGDAEEAIKGQGYHIFRVKITTTSAPKKP